MRALGVDPHEPPKTSQRSMPSFVRSASMSADEVRRGVVLERAERRRASRAALVEDDDAIERGSKNWR
jgi:hypothetical protein